MKYVARKVTSQDRSKTVGFGVFMAWNMVNVNETGSVPIDHCTDPDDDRPLHEQNGKAYKMSGLYPTIEKAQEVVRDLSAFRIKAR